jgi:hypothetical protein
MILFLFVPRSKTRVRGIGSARDGCCAAESASIWNRLRFPGSAQKAKARRERRA